ncbi:MAG: DNA translocase FtsK 4TM domain-containing protein [Candidatus Moraniibacteriota bacterium]
MGRKKKVPVELEEEAGFKFEDILHSDAKRSIAAVFLFALSLLSLLAYFDAAGVFGAWIDAGVGMLLGFGKWLFPLLLVIAGLMFLKRRTTTLADAVKFIGLVVAFFSFLGLIHLYSGNGTKELLKVAGDGQGGGYVGFAFAYLLSNFTGKVAGTIILVALFAIGIIASFNVSLIRFFEQLKERFYPRETEVMPFENSEASLPLGEEKIGGEIISGEESKNLTENNIRKFEFKEDDGEGEITNADLEQDETVLVPAFIRPRKSPRRRGQVRWELPPVDLMESTMGQAAGGDIERNKHIIQSTLRHFGIEVEPGEALLGPTVTQYTFRPAFGVKLSRITALSDNLTLALSAKSIRIEAPIPGQALIGIEVPNQSVATVRLRAILEGDDFKKRRSDLTVVLGLDVAGEHVLADLARMPHVLIAGRTGSGKSVCMNTFLLSLLYQNSPEDMQLILIDPKRVSFSRYKGIPHLKTDVIVESKKVINTLRWAAGQMDQRYKLLEEAGVQDIQAYRVLTSQGKKRQIVDNETGKVREEFFPEMPYIIIMIDEMADLMVTHQKEVEPLIVRLASLARAIGIHLVLATQRPEATVITGLIKANIPARISFQLRSHIDSRTILDASGAEKLLGNGDMLYSAADGKEMRRIQGVFVSDDEVKRVIAFWQKQKQDLGEDEIGGELDDDLVNNVTEAIDAMDNGAKEDSFYEQAKAMTIQTGRVSTTSFQTAFSIGYPRAARLTRLLEDNGVVGMVDGKKAVLIGKEDITATSTIEDDRRQYGDDPLSDQSERDKWQL